jgi:hypothetical protein
MQAKRKIHIYVNSWQGVNYETSFNREGIAENSGN